MVNNENLWAQLRRSFAPINTLLVRIHWVLMLPSWYIYIKYTECWWFNYGTPSWNTVGYLRSHHGKHCMTFIFPKLSYYQSHNLVVGRCGAMMEASVVRVKNSPLFSATRTNVKMQHPVNLFLLPLQDLFCIFLILPLSTVFWRITSEMLSWRVTRQNQVHFWRFTSDTSGSWWPAYKFAVTLKETFILCYQTIGTELP